MTGILYKIYLFSAPISFVLVLLYCGICIFKIKKHKTKKVITYTQDEVVEEDILKVEDSELEKPLTVKYFSIFTLAGFFLGFSGVGLFALSMQIKDIPTILISILIGIASLTIFALIQYAIDLLTKHDAVYSANSIGMYALVLKDVPAKSSGAGSIRVKMNDKVAQFNAVTNNEMTLSKTTKVKIMNSISDTCVVVEKA